MSVLIKALAAAENNKQRIQAGISATDDALSLELPQIQVGLEDKLSKLEIDAGHKIDIEDFGLTLPSNNFTNNRLSLEEEAGLTLVAPSVSKYVALDQSINTSDIKQKAAAKAFVANQSPKIATSKFAFALLGMAGILMIWLGLQGYTYLKNTTSPNLIVVKPKPLPQPTQELETEAVPQKTTMHADQDEAINDATAANITSASVPIERTIELANDSVSKTNNIAPLAGQKIQAKKPTNSHDASMSGDEITQSHSAVRLVSKLPSSAVDPTLLAAYQAFTRGEDASAQQQYRQVLQQDIRNTDALLGMAAIAQRQNRNADAIGWYQKVLEIEPRNPIAQIAIANQQAGTDLVGTESRIKSMITQQPDAGFLHAALGNLYAGQNEWAFAQEAYFNASRYAPNNADYAFNMAISLDQLGKSNLALNQYQRALDLLNKSGASSPDKGTLEARIAALQ